MDIASVFDSLKGAYSIHSLYQQQKEQWQQRQRQVSFVEPFDKSELTAQ
jgi:hypothetical protein